MLQRKKKIENLGLIGKVLLYQATLIFAYRVYRGVYISNICSYEHIMLLQHVFVSLPLRPPIVLADSKVVFNCFKHGG